MMVAIKILTSWQCMLRGRSLSMSRKRRKGGFWASVSLHIIFWLFHTFFETKGEGGVWKTAIFAWNTLRTVPYTDLITTTTKRVNQLLQISSQSGRSVIVTKIHSCTICNSIVKWTKMSSPDINIVVKINRKADA